MKREAVLAAVLAVPASKDFVWDGQDEDDKPASPEALHLAVEAQARKRGRPAGTATKEQVAIRFDRDVLAISEAAQGGSVTERHILYALALKLIQAFGKGPDEPLEDNKTPKGRDANRRGGVCQSQRVRHRSQGGVAAENHVGQAGGVGQHPP
jgi:hypothetical protein